MRYIVIALSLVASNFVFQEFTDQQWTVAAERSFFQCVAVIGCAISDLRMKPEAPR